MTDPDRLHTTEAAEGQVPGDEETGGRTPHPEDPAEGPDSDAGLDVPAPPETPGEV